MLRLSFAMVPHRTIAESTSNMGPPLCQHWGSVQKMGLDPEYGNFELFITFSPFGFWFFLWVAPAKWSREMWKINSSQHLYKRYLEFPGNQTPSENHMLFFYIPLSALDALLRGETTVTALAQYLNTWHPAEKYEIWRVLKNSHFLGFFFFFCFWPTPSQNHDLFMWIAWTDIFYPASYKNYCDRSFHGKWQISAAKTASFLLFFALPHRF